MGPPRKEYLQCSHLLLPEMGHSPVEDECHLPAPGLWAALGAALGPRTVSTLPAAARAAPPWSRLSAAQSGGRAGVGRSELREDGGVALVKNRIFQKW